MSAAWIAVAGLAVDMTYLLLVEFGAVVRRTGPDTGWFPVPCVEATPKRALPVDLPALESELLRLSLHIVVVELGSGFRLRDTRTDLDQDLLEVRSLDGRQELESQTGLLRVLVLQLVCHQGRSVGRELAGADGERSRGDSCGVLRVASLRGVDERDELLRSCQLVTRRRLRNVGGCRLPDRRLRLTRVGRHREVADV